MALEKEIPSFLMNLSSVIQALEDASLSLNPQGQLKPWIERLVHAIQSRGKQGLDEMQAEAGDISSSLLLVVVEIGRLWETGGVLLPVEQTSRGRQPHALYLAIVFTRCAGKEHVPQPVMLYNAALPGGEGIERWRLCRAGPQRIRQPLPLRQIL
ncbi:MAG: hypothetical protein MUC85_09255 [Anaerolineales bacterium]|jgi:hypothetical protein|nr:hypothetical protein [Anaerolineales bacterium]